MRIHRVGGGTYCDALPDGRFAAVVGDRIVTHAGDIQSLGGTVPYGLRLSWGNVLRFGGQGSNIAALVEWIDGHGWQLDTSRVPTRLGVIYAKGETEPRIWQGGPGLDNDGFRFIAADGRSVMCDETRYADGLSEWIDLGDGIRIGQGNPGGGVMVSIDGVLRWLAQGECHAINAKRDGEQCAVAYVIPGDGSYLCWPTVAELRGLPPVVLDEPAPDPEPKPEPDPEPEPSTMKPDASLVDYFHRRWSELRVLERTRALTESGHATEHSYREIQSGAFIQITAEWEHVHRQGVSSTLVGFYPYDGTSVEIRMDDGSTRRINENILLLKVGVKVYWKDIIIGCGGPNPSLNLSASDEFEEGESKFLTPPKHYAKGADPKPDPDPTPDPEPKPDPKFEARLAAVEKHVAQMSAVMLKSGDRVLVKAPDGSSLKSVGGGNGEARFGWAHDRPGAEPEAHEIQTIEKVNQ